MLPTVTEVYEEAAAYALAFSYRDVPVEVDTILAWCQRYGAGWPGSAIELAAGPADHALELAARGVPASALDLSGAMCAYARQRAAGRGLPLDVAHADMTTFDLGRRFDLALLMLNSATHLLTLDALLAMLDRTAVHVRPGGLLVLENSHPADFLTPAPHTVTEWTVTSPGLTVYARWGTGADPFDAVTQVQQTAVRLVARPAGGPELVIEQTVAERVWTATELAAAVRLSPGWELAGTHGTLAGPDLPLTDEAAWRMIHILRRRSAS
jgi:SAM-dependent methyltransferase